MAKKHCEKHKSYVYNCEDCRIMNNEPTKSASIPAKKSSRPKKTKETKKTKKTKKIIKKTTKKEEKPPVKIPIKEEFDDFEEEEREEETRFRYRKPPSRRKRISILAGVIVVTIIVLIIAVYAVPKWWGRISLNNQLYANKTSITSSYWNFLVLDYWSTRFILNKTGLIAGLIGCVVFSVPPENKIFTVITQRFGWRKMKYWKVIVIWWTAGFVVFYLLGQLIDVFSNFSLVMYMSQHAELDISIGNAFSSFAILKDPSSIDILSVFVYSNLYKPIINYILILIIVRLIISIVSNIFIDFDYYNVAAKASFIIALFFTMNFFSIPSKTFDGLKLITVWTTPLAMIGFTLLGVLCMVYPRIRENIDRFSKADKKRTIIAAISLIVLILIPSFISIPTSVKINNDQTVWEEEKWDTQLAVEREWTVNAAGLDMFNHSQEIRSLNASGNIAKSIRQYDKEAALFQMNSYAQTTFEGLADSDIVNVLGKEYWVSPKTLKYEDFIAADNIRKHTNQFDHVEGILAIDPYTGELISNDTEFTNIFGVDRNYPIFFGEHELEANNTNIGAFDDDILLNTDWDNSPQNYNYTYQGEKDGTLTGLSAFWFTLDMGLTSYALDRNFQKDFLINRNIKDRVGNILLPGLEIDEDPYLVFDQNSSTVYYALSIYTKISLTSYARSELLRYIGTVLIDVKLGTLDFVENPYFKLHDINPSSDPMYNLWKFYTRAYPWEDSTLNTSKYFGWLTEQLRYPEELFELQLSQQYTYHVDDPNDWRGGSQFYARPPSGDLFYVRFDLGEEEGLEFVGVDLVQRKGTEANTLAGMYVLRHGIHFGEVRFYSASEVGQTNMIGPNTAEQSLIAAATQDLVLIDKEDYGNVLLYPLGTSLYYFVPVYSTSADERFQVLKIAGFVNAFNALDVVYGTSAEEAYKLLNLNTTEEIDSGNVTLTYEMDDTSLENDILLDVYVKSNNLNFTGLPQNVQVNISVESDIVDIFRPGVSYLENSTFIWGSGETGMNYTILDESLDPLEGFSTTVRLTPDLGSVYSITIKLKVILIVDGVAYEPDFYEFVTFYK